MVAGKRCFIQNLILMLVVLFSIEIPACSKQFNNKADLFNMSIEELMAIEVCTAGKGRSCS